MSKGAKAVKDEEFSGQTGYFDIEGSPLKKLIHEDDIYRQGISPGSARMDSLGAMGAHLTRKTWEKLPPQVRAELTRRNQAQKLYVEQLDGRFQRDRRQ